METLSTSSTCIQIPCSIGHHPSNISTNKKLSGRIKMQAATLLFATPLSLNGNMRLETRQLLPISRRRPLLFRRVFACATPTADSSTVDYSSSASVFPAEACDTLGGEACEMEMFPEAKLPVQQAGGTKATVPEEVDREYVEYDEPKTVFPGEACDDLGGEFCEPEYQQGVYKENLAK